MDMCEERDEELLRYELRLEDDGMKQQFSVRY